MASLAQIQIDVPVPVMQASEGLVPILEEHGFSLAEGSFPGAAAFVFGVKRKAFRNAMQGSASFIDNGAGSTIELQLDVAPGESKTLLDGRRNRATLQELTEEISAKLRGA
jgi:hypothetical protein